MRLLHAHGVFMLGPEANHYMTVSHAENFRWREGSLGDLIPFLGDGLLTIDGEYHRRSRKIDAARIPPRAHSGRRGDDGRRGRARGRRLARRRTARPLRVDARSSRCGSR